MQRSRYAALVLGQLKGVKCPSLDAPFFKEFVVSFEHKTVEEVNKALLEKEIFGGKNLTVEFPRFGQSALYSVTEIHTKEDIDTLAAALEEVL